MPNYTIDFTAEQLNIVSAGLAKLPYEVAHPMIEAIRALVRRQDDERAKAAEAAKASDGVQQPQQPRARRKRQPQLNGTSQQPEASDAH